MLAKKKSFISSKLSIFAASVEDFPRISSGISLKNLTVSCNLAGDVSVIASAMSTAKPFGAFPFCPPSNHSLA